MTPGSAPCFLKALFWRLCPPRGSGALDHAHSNRLTSGDSLSILAPWQEKKLREDNAPSLDEASRESGGECAALAPLLAWDCGRDRERQCWSGLLSSGEVVLAPSLLLTPSPPPSRPTPFLGQVGQSTWKQAGLQTPCLPHLPPNPQHTLVPGRMKAPAPTTKQWLRRLNRSTGNKLAAVNLHLQWCPVLSCDAGTQTASVWACTLTECPYTRV